MQKTSIIVLFLAGLLTFGSTADLSLKQKLKGLSQLGEVNTGSMAGTGACSSSGAAAAAVGVPTLGDLSGDLLSWCPCQFGQQNVTLGQAESSAFAQAGAVSQAVSVQTVPDTQQMSDCQSECCACNAAAHECAKNGTRTRVFDINGQITIAESIEFEEAGLCRERSEGRSEKTTSCVVNNQATVGAAPTQCQTVTICPPSVGTGSSSGIGAVQPH